MSYWRCGYFSRCWFTRRVELWGIRQCNFWNWESFCMGRFRQNHRSLWIQGGWHFFYSLNEASYFVWGCIEGMGSWIHMKRRNHFFFWRPLDPCVFFCLHCYIQRKTGQVDHVVNTASIYLHLPTHVVTLLNVKRTTCKKPPNLHLVNKAWILLFCEAFFWDRLHFFEHFNKSHDSFLYPRHKD